MPHTTAWEEHGVYRKFSDRISAEEILASNFEMHEQPRFADIHYVINDFSAVSGVDLEHAHTEIYAKTDNYVAHTKNKLKIALVVTNPDYLPLAENYRRLMLDSVFDCEIFSALQEARDWTAA